MEFVNFLSSTIGSPMGSFGFVISVLLGVFWAIHKVSIVIATHNTEKSHLAINITEVKTVQQNIGLTISEMSGVLRYITENIADIKSELKDQKREKDGLAEHRSPLKLTEKGEEVAILINADQLLANHWQKIQGDILEKKQDTDNPYDIQQICFTYFENLESILISEELNEIKLVAYNRGESLDIYDIIFGIKTRDKIFEYLDIPLGKIDEHTPKKNPPI